MLKIMLKKSNLDFGEKWHATDEDIEKNNQFLDCGLALPSGVNHKEFSALLGIVAQEEDKEDDGEGEGEEEIVGNQPFNRTWDGDGNEEYFEFNDADEDTEWEDMYE